MKGKKIVLLLLVMVAVTQAFSQAGNAAVLTLINKSEQSFKEKVVSIPWARVIAAYPGIDTANLKIVNAANRQQINYQLEYAGNASIHQLLVQVNLPPRSEVKLLLQKAKPLAVATKSYGRFVPERKDDFAWENDKIAFRMYGKALENTPKENAYGIDVWVKRTSRMVINERYKKAEYHVDHGDGLDYYHVGLTLGAGNSMPYINDSIWYSKNFVGWKLLDNGPLRTTFQLLYDAWQVAGKSVKVTKTISLDAGSHFNKVVVDYQYEGNEPMPVVVGIIKRPQAGTMLLNEEQGVLGYWEPAHGADGTTGVACIIPYPIKSMQVDKTHLFAVTQINKSASFVYYMGAAWNKAGQITNAQQWFDHINQYRQQVENGLITTR